LPATDLEGSWALADRIRTAVRDSPVVLGPGVEVVATVSAGCSESAGDHPAELVARAARALAEAQAAGPNRVVAAAG
ncbi:MAG: hypothetical protein ACRD0M_05915, partial [Acidimicrobiales bacterium]